MAVTPAIAQGRLVIPLLLLVLVLLAAPCSLACDDPSQHPGMAAFLATVQSLGPQPKGPLQVRYKVEDGRSAGQTAIVELSFWSTEPYEAGQVTVTPSADVELVGFSGSRDIPYRGAFNFTIRALRDGYHHLRLDTLVRTTDGQEIRKTVFVPFPVGPEQSHTARPDAPQGAGFAGPRMQRLLQTRGDDN